MSLLGLFRNEAESTCQEHLYIATQGVYPNFSTFQMVLLGFGCSIEIEIEGPPDTGGGWGQAWWGQPESKITVRVTFKNKTFVQSIHTPIPDVSLITVLAKLKGIKGRITEVFAKVKKLWTL